MTTFLYPYEISLETIAKLYFDGSTVVERLQKYIVIMTSDGKKIACAEKFSKYPEGYDGYLVLSKKTSRENTICLTQIIKKIPELRLEEKEKSNYFKLKKFIDKHNRYPMIYENEELYHYIRDICDSKDQLSESDIQRMEALPNWIWDYSRLTKEGEKFSDVIKTAENGSEFTIEQKRILKLMLSKLERKILSVYFENKIRQHGLNI